MSGRMHKKKVQMQIKQNNSCFPKKLSSEKKLISTKYVDEYILTSPISIKKRTNKHEIISKFFKLFINYKVLLSVWFQIFRD